LFLQKKSKIITFYPNLLIFEIQRISKHKILKTKSIVKFELVIL
jgi:hypothetical protein